MRSEAKASEDMKITVARWPVCLAIAYAVFAHYASAVSDIGAWAILLAGAPMLIVGFGFARESRHGACSGVARHCRARPPGLGLAAPAQPRRWLYFLQHVGINVALGAGLRPHAGPAAPAAGHRGRRIVHEEMTPALIRYTRQVTAAWTLFFVACALVSAGLFFFAPIEAWSVFANILSLPLIGLMFLVENEVRKRVLPPQRPGRPGRHRARLARQLPAMSGRAPAAAAHPRRRAHRRLARRRSDDRAALPRRRRPPGRTAAGRRQRPQRLPGPLSLHGRLRRQPGRRQGQPAAAVADAREPCASSRTTRPTSSACTTATATTSTCRSWPFRSWPKAPSSDCHARDRRGPGRGRPVHLRLDRHADGARQDAGARWSAAAAAKPSASAPARPRLLDRRHRAGAAQLRLRVDRPADACTAAAPSGAGGPSTRPTSPRRWPPCRGRACW